MHISKILNDHQPCLSFEFFPPKTAEAANLLYQNIKELLPLNPGYVSVTYGAGGGTRELTHDLLLKIKRDTELTVVSHLTCVGHTQDEIFQILEKYQQHGIDNIMALRGDPPRGQSSFAPTSGGFKYAAELVSFIKKKFPQFGIGIAGFPEGHPECPNRLMEMDYLKAKVDAGADYICTQLFFDNRDFYDFCERCEIAQIKIPIIAGIMPISSSSGMKRMAELALGAKFPAKLLRSIARAEKSHEKLVEQVGVHWATEQVLDLLNHNVRGIHFYTLNKSEATRTIYQSAGLHHLLDQSLS
jgi:methylenetetrahydrofolate reductase (NADPH)